MARIQSVQTSFADGQISPRMQGYVDLPSYRSSLKLCHNYIPLPQGSLARRPGTFYVSRTKDNLAVRLIPFNFGSGQSYILEFGPSYIRFYREDAIVLTDPNPSAATTISSVNHTTNTITLNSGTGVTALQDIYFTTTNTLPNGLLTNQRYFVKTVSSANITLSLADNIKGAGLDLPNVAGSGTATLKIPLHTPTTYTADELADINFSQSADVLFIAHPDHAPAELKRISDTSWTLTDLALKDGPFLPVNTEETTLGITRDSAVIAKIKDLAASDIDTSGNKFTVVNHGLVDGQTLRFSGGMSNVTNDATYYVINATLDTFQISTTYGGEVNNVNSTGTTPAVHYVDYGFEAVGEMSGNAVISSEHMFTMLSHPLVNGQQVFFRGGGGEQVAQFLPAAVTVADDDITLSGHELENGNVVRLTNSVGTPDLPSGLAVGQNYYVVNRETNKIQLSESKGGTPVTIGDQGTGTHTISYSGIQSISENTMYYVVSATLNTFKLGTSVTGDPVEFIGTVSKDVKFFKKFIPKNSRVDVVASAVTGINDDSGFVSTDSGRLIRINTEVAPQIKWGYITVTSRADATNIEGTVQEHLAFEGNTTEFSLGSFSSTTGYPRTVQIYQQRLCLAGTTEEPQTVHFSKTGDFDNFSASEPLGVQTGKYSSAGAAIMGEQVYSDNALSLMISSDTVDLIEWISEGRRLSVGTSGGIFQMFGNRDDVTLTPFNFTVEKISNWSAHSAALPAKVGNNLIYAQKNGRKLRELVFDRQQEQYSAKDISLRAEDITQTGVLEMFFQDQPASQLWVVRTDGKLASCTYNIDLEMASWALHTLGGTHTHASYGNHSKVESIAVIPRGTYDQLWMVVARDVDEYFTQFPYTAITDGTDKITIAGHGMANGTAVKITTDGTMPTNLTSGTTYYVRATDTDDFELATASGGAKIAITQGAGTHTIYKVGVTQRYVEFLSDYYDNSMDQGDAHYVDCGAYYTGSSVSTLTGLHYAEGSTFSVLGNKASQPDKVVQAGILTPALAVTAARVGFAFNSDIQTLALAIGDPATGTSIGNRKRIHRIHVKILDTMGLKYGIDTSSLTTETFRLTSDIIGQALPLFTGDRELPMPGIYDTLGEIYLRQDQPFPSNLLHIAIDYETNE